MDPDEARFARLGGDAQSGDPLTFEDSRAW
jgi:hypothetical protein